MGDRSAPKARGVFSDLASSGAGIFGAERTASSPNSILLLVDELAESRKQLSRSSAARLHDDPAAPTTLVHLLFDQRAGARGLFIGAKAVAPIERADAGFRADLGNDRADQALVQECVSVLLRLYGRSASHCAAISRSISLRRGNNSGAIYSASTPAFASPLR